MNGTVKKAPPRPVAGALFAHLFGLASLFCLLSCAINALRHEKMHAAGFAILFLFFFALSLCFAFMWYMQKHPVKAQAGGA